MYVCVCECVCVYMFIILFIPLAVGPFHNQTPRNPVTAGNKQNFVESNERDRDANCRFHLNNRRQRLIFEHNVYYTPRPLACLALTFPPRLVETISHVTQNQKKMDNADVTTCVLCSDQCLKRWPNFFI